MIRYLKNKEVDVKKWDKCILGAFNGNAYGMSWYLDIVHDGWEALVEGDYERVMPLTVARKYGIDYMFQPYFTQQLGIYSLKKLSPAVTSRFLDHIPDHIKYVEVNLNSFNKVKSDSHSVKMNVNYVQDLIHEYPKISSRYSTNTKRNLKKSLQANLSVIKNIKPEVLIKLFRENRGRKVENLKDRDYQKLKRLMYSAMYKGSGLVYGVFTPQNTLCAGAYFIKSNKRLIFLFSGTDQTARQTGAMTLLIDSVIREFSPSQIVLDFEGSNDEHLARFYSGFGARKLEYPRVTINKLSRPANWILSLYKILK